MTSPDAPRPLPFRSAKEVADVIYKALWIARDVDLAGLTEADGVTKPDHLVAGTTWAKALENVAAVARRASSSDFPVDVAIRPADLDLFDQRIEANRQMPSIAGYEALVADLRATLPARLTETPR